MAAAVIAVVDDDETMLETTAAILSEEGYQVVVWSEGKTAYDFVQQHQPDLLILDLHMDHPQAGWLVIHMLRLNPQTARLPVLVCTGDFAYVRMRHQILREQHCDVLLKPFSVDDLLAKVTYLLGEPLDTHDPSASPTVDRAYAGRKTAWRRVPQRFARSALERIGVLKRRQ